MTSSSGPVPVVDGRREGGLDTLRVATGARGHRRRREGQGARTLEIRHFWPKYPRCIRQEIEEKEKRKGVNCTLLPFIFNNKAPTLWI